MKMSSLKIYYENDIQTNILKDLTIGIVGYGSQGQAHADNLHDNGYNVIIGLYNGSSSWEKAKNNGLEVYTVPEMTNKADIIMILLPDEIHKEVFEKDIKPYLKAGQTILFGHGFSVHYGEIDAPKNINIGLVAPKGAGQRIRAMFREGKGMPALISSYQDPSQTTFQIALEYAKGIGSARAGIIETTFAEETETDLFGEQAVLCGGIAALIEAGFDTLTKAGYQPAMAYIECIHELKLVVDLLHEGGLSYMNKCISNTAEYGEYTAKDSLINAGIKDTMEKILKKIQSGEFAEKFLADSKLKEKSTRQITQNNLSNLSLEQIGSELRAIFQQK